MTLALGSDVRTEAPVISRRGRALFTKVAREILSIMEGDVKNAFLQGHSARDDEHFSAEPVQEVSEFWNLRRDQVVSLRKLCYGLSGAPRQWWSTLQTGVAKHGVEALSAGTLF